MRSGIFTEEDCFMATTEFRADPRPRPQNLPELTEFPEDTPVTIPATDGDKETFEWCEQLRDHYEKEGKLLTVEGLCKIAEAVGLTKADTRSLQSQIIHLYGHGKPKKSKTSKSSTPPSPKTKEKTMTATLAPKKKTKKVKKAGKPSGNGHVPHLEGRTVADKTVSGVPIKVIETESGRFNVRLFGDLAVRPCLRTMGYDGWETKDAVTALGKLLKGISFKSKVGTSYESGESYVKELADEGHVNCGAKGKIDKSDGAIKASSFGKSRPFTSAESKALKALKK
jgi:hypothetical protein